LLYGEIQLGKGGYIVYNSTIVFNAQ